MKRFLTQPLPNSLLVIALLALIYFTFNVYYETISFAWGFSGILISIMIIAASFISIDPRE
jgi:hypothetical protein